MSDQGKNSHGQERMSQPAVLNISVPGYFRQYTGNECFKFTIYFLKCLVLDVALCGPLELTRQLVMRSTCQVVLASRILHVGDTTSILSINVNTSINIYTYVNIVTYFYFISSQICCCIYQSQAILFACQLWRTCLSVGWQFARRSPNNRYINTTMASIYEVYKVSLTQTCKGSFECS